MREFELYRAYYCGLCKQLGQTYGQFSRLLLNYDLVLVALLADALSGEKGQPHAEGCIVNPVVKRTMMHQTDGLALAADGLVMLSYHQLLDHMADEGGKRVLYAPAYPVLRRQYKKAEAKRPELAQVISRQMQRQQELEAAGCKIPDEACDPTAQMCAALFQEAACHEEQKHILHRLGLFSGQIVYLLDAAEDFDKDFKNNRYNVFIKNEHSQASAIETVKTRCRMAAGELALCYNLLSIQQYKPILDNIFFLGLPSGIAAAGLKTTRRNAGHGQIDSL